MLEITMKTPVGELNGVGKVREAQLSRLGVSTVGDLVYLFPRAYEMRGDVRPLSKYDPERPCAFMLTVSTEVKQTTIRRGLTISKLRAFDDSGSVEITFFNSPFVKDVFHIGSTFRFWGKAAIQKNKLQLTNPKYEPYVEGVPLADFVPIYPLTEGISSKQIDKLIKLVLNDVLPEIKDPIPEKIRLENSLTRCCILESAFPYRLHKRVAEAALSSPPARLPSLPTCFHTSLPIHKSKQLTMYIAIQ